RGAARCSSQRDISMPDVDGRLLGGVARLRPSEIPRLRAISDARGRPLRQFQAPVREFKPEPVFRLFLAAAHRRRSARGHGPHGSSRARCREGGKHLPSRHSWSRSLDKRKRRLAPNRRLFVKLARVVVAYPTLIAMDLGFALSDLGSSSSSTPLVTRARIRSTSISLEIVNRR